MGRPRIVGEEILLNMGIEKFRELYIDEKDKDDGIRDGRQVQGFF